MTDPEKRYHNAIEACGGAEGLLALPAEIQNALKVNADLETKVLMLELVALMRLAEEL